jgi:23S rRNA (uracil1939-C5)-methyltransferase
MKTAALLQCPHSETCGICAWIQIPYERQRERKLGNLRSALQNAGISHPQEIRFLSAGPSEIRDRVDLIFEKGKYGFYQSSLREVFEVQSCLQMSQDLMKMFLDLKKIPLPIQKGSLRLRVSPTGERGLWLDFANLDVKRLLEEQNTLKKMLDLGFVEIGQKRKKLSSSMKLIDPEARFWTRTWTDGKALPLYSYVGSFSQVGDRANQILIQELQSFFDEALSRQWVEFGSGHGNLTFALATKKERVLALESDPLALQGLEKSLKENSQFQNKISVSAGDFQQRKTHAFQKQEGVLVNPPRSGLQNFLAPLFELEVKERPQDFIYMSCYLDSFLTDAKKLESLGYRIEKLSVVDQFPQTAHFEILTRWRLISLSN